MSKDKQQPDESLLAELIVKYKPYWPVFVILAVCCLTASFVYLKYAQPKYKASASLIIKDEKKGYEDPMLMESLNPMGAKKIIENEIEVLQSRNTMEKIVRQLKLYAPVFEHKGLLRRRLYENSPLSIEAASPDLINEKEKDLQIKISKYNDSVFIDDIYSGLSGEWLNTSHGPLKIKVDRTKINPDNDVTYSFRLYNVQKTSKLIIDQLKVHSANKLSSIVELEYKDCTPGLAEDVLNQIIISYNEDALLEKNNAAKNAIKFIEGRLSVVGTELTEIERKIEQYKANSGAVDISKQGHLFLETVRDNDKKLSDINLQISVMDELAKQLSSNAYMNGIQTATIGNVDPILSQLIVSLNTAELDRERLKKTVAVNNPVLVAVSDQIAKIKNDIFSFIQHQRKNLAATQQNLSYTNANYNGMLYSIPVKERELLELSRDQEIKSGIYSFLLQKREESELSYASNIADSRVVNNASASKIPVSPNNYMVYAIALFSIIALPIGIIGAKETLASNILFRNEIERLTGIPIIGEVSFHKSVSPLAVETGKRSLVAEEFRRIRYALQYYLNKNSNKKILVTSSISGEGKSFISANLAISFSMTGKKVALVDFDLHQSSLEKIFGSENKIGLSEYLSGNATLEELPMGVENYDNLYFITAGKAANDPSESLEGSRSETLLKYLDDHFDLVIIDCSPLALVTDANYLSGFCNTTIYVVRHGYSPKFILKRLDENNAVNPLVNPVIIFSGIRNRGFTGNRNSYGYGYAYGMDHKKVKG
jgi:capsular exopolysaccharide synthesis family protein